jgi:uncharacterized protein YerC
MENKLKNSNKSVWFDGSIQINCSLKKINDSFKNIGKSYTEITKLMSGINMAKLVKQGDNFVTIQTNEGIMKRKNISKKIQENTIVIEFDEEYQAGKSTTTISHHLEEYAVKDSKINYHLIISDVTASGFLGLLYRIFGKKNIGNAILKSYKTYLEK